MVDQFYFDLAKAVRWIYKNRNGPQYWEWEDLTSKNSDPTNLGLSDATAWNIFTVLESNRLMHRFPYKKNGREIDAFRIDLSDPKKWADFKHDPTRCWRTWIAVRSFFIKFWKFILWIISLVITTGLTYGLTRWIDNAYPITNG